MSEQTRPARKRQSGAIEIALRQLEARSPRDPESGVVAPEVRAANEVAPKDRPRPVYYPLKGPASVPPESCRPWTYADRPEAEFGHLDELAGSLKADGQLQPAIVRPVSDPAHPEIRYEIIAGQARWRAAKRAGAMLDVVIHPKMDDEAAFRAMVGENEFRRGLSDFARAKRFKAALERGLYATKSDMASSLRIRPSDLSYLLGFAELDQAVVEACREIGAIPARLGYVLNQLVQAGERAWVLDRLREIDDGTVTRAMLEDKLRGRDDANEAAPKDTPASTSGERRSSTVVASADGQKLFAYRVDPRGCSISLPTKVANVLDPVFWAELREAIERRLKDQGGDDELK
mgnify:CR=1 FL=1